MLISTHIVEDVEAVCDHVIVMNNGAVLTNKTGEQLAQIATGKVYQVAADNQSQLPPQAFIRARLEVPGQGQVLSVLCNQPVNGTSVAPTIEDGYLCLLKNI